MRSSLVLSFVASLAMAGCEDGPTQVYQSAPPGAGNQWNNGNTPGSTDNAEQPFVNHLGGNNAMQICTGDQLAQRWAVMVKEPIIPPRFGGGLDLAGGDTWAGITIEQAEQINCQSTNYGDAFGDGTQVNYWGDNGELWMDYRVSNHKAYFLTMWPGYIGPMDFKSPDGQHTYEIIIQQQILKDGKPFTLDWVGNKGANFTAPADELYRALTATYAPGLPQDAPGVTCFSTGRCVKGSFGDVAYFYIPAIGWAFWIDNQNAPQPTPSIATRLDQNLAKVMPYAFASPLLKLDAEGSIGIAGLLGKATNPCTLKMGLTFADFLSDCVQVDGDQASNQTELNKLLGGLTHGTERFGFDVQGIDIEFTDEHLAATDIVHDKDVPTSGDHSTSFLVDQSTLGTFSNDYDLNGNVDLHGTGQIYKEYARLVRATLLSTAGIKDGDTTKCFFDHIPTNAEIAALPAYCTGFENMITPAAPTGPNDRTNLGYANAVLIDPNYKLGMKLGHQKVVFCWDNTGDINTGYNICDQEGDTFSTSFAKVLHVFGKDKLANLPTDCQDVRFFFKQYIIALLKYLTVGNENPVVTKDISGINIKEDDLFFDSIGAGQFEIAEYVDRRFTDPVDPLKTPTDFVFTADVRNGIFDEYEFTRDLLRGETAVYAAIRENQNDALGEESNALLTNIFGSPLLKGGWKDSMEGKSAYYCATNYDKANCDGQTPPLDSKGNVLLDDQFRPILAPYPGAFSSTAFSLGTTPIKVDQTFDTIQQATVRVPIHSNPYDSSSSLLPALSILIPWVPKQPGIGFYVPLSGTLEKFIQTYQLDFSGEEISANVDYDFVLDPNTHMPVKGGQIQFLAVETTDFLGNVFLCQDPNTGDILSARMYTPVANILDWYGTHPGAYDSCGTIIRYSPYGNFADYITTLQNGVRLSITQGGGFGRVNDVQLFVPGQ